MARIPGRGKALLALIAGAGSQYLPDSIEVRDGGFAWLLIFLKQFVNVFDEADYDDDGGARHADEEHDFKNVHCHQAESHSLIVDRRAGEFHGASVDVGGA